MNQYKVVVTVPEDEADALREAIGNAGAGRVGDYSHCSYSTKGMGRFLPLDGAHPTIGEVGKLEQVVEERIEVNCNSDNLQDVVNAIRASHSYEEPAIDIYQLVELPARKNIKIEEK